MNVIARQETGLAKSLGYRRGQQADVIDTLYVWLENIGTAYFTTYQHVAAITGVSPSSVRKALSDARSPFKRYEVIGKETLGILIALPSIAIEQCHRVAAKHTKGLHKLRVNGEDYFPTETHRPVELITLDGANIPY